MFAIDTPLLADEAIKIADGLRQLAVDIDAMRSKVAALGNRGDLNLCNVQQALEDAIKELRYEADDIDDAVQRWESPEPTPAQLRAEYYDRVL